MMQLRYMQANAEDVNAIFLLSKELIDRYEDLSAIDYDKVIAWVNRKITGNISRYTRVCQGEKTVAYFCLDKNGEMVELDDLYVLPEYRGKGIGTEIIRKCIASAEKSIFLYVFNNNLGAVSLYERMGFVKREDVSRTRCIMVRNG